MAKLHLQQAFSHEFRPLQLFSVGPPSLRRRRALLQRIFRRKNEPFFGGKMRSATRGSVSGGSGKLAFFAGVLAQNPLDFISFPLRKTTHTWSCQFFLSWALLTAPTNCKQVLLWGKACCTPVFGPPSSLGGLCHFEVRGWFFCPDIFL